jgi:hypothetical protein
MAEQLDPHPDNADIPKKPVPVSKFTEKFVPPLWKLVIYADLTSVRSTTHSQGIGHSIPETSLTDHHCRELTAGLTPSNEGVTKVKHDRRGGWKVAGLSVFVQSAPVYR